MGTNISPVSIAAQSSLLQAREDRMLGQMQSLKSERRHGRKD